MFVQKLWIQRLKMSRGCGCEELAGEGSKIKELSKQSRVVKGQA